MASSEGKKKKEGPDKQGNGVDAHAIYLINRPVLPSHRFQLGAGIMATDRSRISRYFEGSTLVLA